MYGLLYHQLTAWLHLHPHWGFFLAFAISFTESIAIIGTIIPGSITMTAIGILAGSRVIAPELVIGFAIFGAVLGDVLSYGAGYYFKNNIPKIWPFNKYPTILEKGKYFFVKHGGKSVFIGRFVGPVRAIVPMIAGMLHMEVKQYLMASIPAAFLWAPFYMLPGILIGAISLEIPKDIATGLIITVLLALVLFWVLLKLFNILYKKTHDALALYLDRKWQIWRVQGNKKWLCDLLHHVERSEQRGNLMLAISSIAAFLLFLMIFWSVTKDGDATVFNEAVFHLFRGLRSHLLDTIAVFLTSLGENKVLMPLATVLFLWFCLQRKWAIAVHWLLGNILAFGSIGLIKYFYYSPRPTGILNPPITSSFPSGHTTLAIVMYGMIAFFIARNVVPTLRKNLYWQALLIWVLIAFSRLYLCVHWLTDVIAGFCLGLSILWLVMISFLRYPSPRLSLPYLFGIIILVLGVSDAIFLNHQYQEHLQDYQTHWETQYFTEHDWWEHHVLPPVPEYRTNRLSRPAEVLNIQWEGELTEIQRTLTAHGWMKLQFKDYKALLPKLYNDQRPALAVIKYAKDENTPSVVLELWPTSTLLMPRKLALWIGTLYYDHPRHYLIFFTRHKINNLPTDQAITTLIPNLFLDQWETKSADFNDLPRKLQKNPPQLLLIRPR